MSRTQAYDLQFEIHEHTAKRNVAALAEMLDEKTPAPTRRRAHDALFSIRTAEAYDALADVAAGVEIGLNEEILYGLRDTPGDDALRALSRVLSSENTIRRALVVSLLASRSEPTALALLLRGARDPSKAVTRIAEKALLARVAQDSTQLAALPKESVAGIVSYVPFEVARELVAPHFPSVVRAEASRRLGKAGGIEAVGTLVALTNDADPAVARAAWEGLRGVGSLPATFLLPFLGDRNDELRCQGVELFARCCGAPGAPLVAGMLRDRAAKVRQVAARALFQLQGEESLPFLRRLLVDPEIEVRRVVIEALASSPSATEDLIGVVIAESGDLRQRALMATASRGVYRPHLAPAYLDFLNEHAASPKPTPAVVDAMAAIAKILGDAHESRALEGFAALCRTTSRRLRRTGIEAILHFPLEERADVLVQLSDTRDTHMLSAIAIDLGEAKDTRAIIPLIRASSECGGRSSRRAAELMKNDPRLTDLDFLIELLFNKWASARKFSAERLRQTDDVRCIDPLLRASEDEDVEVQLASIEALGAYAAKEARVSARLIHATEAGDVTVRQAAVEALGQAKIEMSVPNLIKCLHNVFLRPRSEEALKNIGGRQGYLAMKRLRRREEMFGKKNRRRPQRRRMPD